MDGASLGVQALGGRRRKGAGICFALDTAATRLYLRASNTCSICGGSEWSWTWVSCFTHVRRTGGHDTFFDLVLPWSSLVESRCHPRQLPIKKHTTINTKIGVFPPPVRFHIQQHHLMVDWLPYRLAGWLPRFFEGFTGGDLSY